MIYKASNHPVFDSNVATIQRNLNHLNQMLGGNAWSSLGEDGMYGRDTARAVKAFQTLYHLSPDGQYGNETDAALKMALSDAKAEKNGVPVKASINGGHKRTSKTKQLVDPETGAEVPVASINSVASEVSQQQDDFMCAPLTTCNKEKPQPNFKIKSYSEICEEFITDTKGRIADLMSAFANAANADNKSLDQLVNRIKKALDNFYKGMQEVMNKYKPQILRRGANPNSSTVLWDSKQITQNMHETQKEFKSKGVNSGKDAALRARSGNLPKVSIPPQSLLKKAGWIGFAITLLDPLLCLFETPKDSAWGQKFRSKVFKCIDNLVVSAIAGLIAAGIVGASAPLWLFIAVGWVISTIFSFIYTAITGEEISLSEIVSEFVIEQLADHATVWTQTPNEQAKKGKPLTSGQAKWLGR